MAFLASSKLALLRLDHLRLLTSLDAGEGEGDFEALGFNEGVRCCLLGTWGVSSRRLLMDIRALLLEAEEAEGWLSVKDTWSAPKSEQGGEDNGEKVGEDRLGEPLDEGEGEREGEEAERAGCTSIAFRRDSMLVPRYAGPVCFCSLDLMSSMACVVDAGSFWKRLS